jgi:chromosome segregation ATPase
MMNVNDFEIARDDDHTLERHLAINRIEAKLDFEQKNNAKLDDRLSVAEAELREAKNQIAERQQALQQERAEVEKLRKDVDFLGKLLAEAGAEVERLRVKDDGWRRQYDSMSERAGNAEAEVERLREENEVLRAEAVTARDERDLYHKAWKDSEAEVEKQHHDAGPGPEDERGPNMKDVG